MVMDPNTSIFPGVSQYSGRHWLKSGMRWLYGVDYIHAWIAFRLGGHRLVYHSTAAGLHIAGYDATFDTGDRIVRAMYQIDLGPAGFTAFVADCLSEVPKKYSNRQLLGMAASKGLSKIGIHYGRPLFGAGSKDDHVCSESAGRMLHKHLNIPWGGIDPDMYTPRDLVDVLEQLRLAGRAALAGTGQIYA